MPSHVRCVPTRRKNWLCAWKKIYAGTWPSPLRLRCPSLMRACGIACWVRGMRRVTELLPCTASERRISTLRRTRMPRRWGVCTRWPGVRCWTGCRRARPRRCWRRVCVRFLRTASATTRVVCRGCGSRAMTWTMRLSKPVMRRWHSFHCMPRCSQRRRPRWPVMKTRRRGTKRAASCRSGGVPSWAVVSAVMQTQRTSRRSAARCRA